MLVSDSTPKCVARLPDVRSHAVERVATYLPKAFVEECFEFHGKTLSGAPKQRDRWKRGITRPRCVGRSDRQALRSGVFLAAEKARAQAMVDNLIAAFARRIDQLGWMAAQTKAKAKAKLSALKIGVGYPDRWIDYSALESSGATRSETPSARPLFDSSTLAKLGQPVDRYEWVMNPQIVNAVNLPAMNAMNFPAAILQPPLFRSRTAGGHGLRRDRRGHRPRDRHSFDDQGALFDAEGSLKTGGRRRISAFRGRREPSSAQYDAYVRFPISR